MSEAVSIERRKIIRAYGGTVRLTPAAEGTDGAIRLARKLGNTYGCWLVKAFACTTITKISFAIAW